MARHHALNQTYIPRSNHPSSTRLQTVTLVSVRSEASQDTASALLHKPPSSRAAVTISFSRAGQRDVLRRTGNISVAASHALSTTYPCPSCTTAEQGDHEDVNRASQVTSRPSHVQERLIGALIPDALGTRTECATVPLPALPALSQLDTLQPASLLVSTSRMDRSGRIHERILLHQLGWHPGTRLEMDTMHGMILIAATPTNHHTIDQRGAIKLPAAFRRLCEIKYGPPLVLAAATPKQVMVVHPSAVVAHLLATHYTDLINTDQAHAEPDTAQRGSP